jgi:hypothetical protein
VKYTLGRIGLFVLVALALWPVSLNLFLKLMLALAFSAAASFFLLRRWRDEMAQQLAAAADRRKTEKERLRAALSGEDQPGGDRPANRPSTAEDRPAAQQPPMEPGEGPPAR